MARLVVAGVVRLEHWELIAYTYKMAYDMGVQDVRVQSFAPGDGERGMAIDCCGAGWGRRRTLLYMQARIVEAVTHPDSLKKFGSFSTACFCPSRTWI